MPLGKLEPHENDKLGLRDAFHVACVLCEKDGQTDPPPWTPAPGMPVRFTGDSFTAVRPALPGEPAHGIIDPFLTLADLSEYHLFWVLVRPGLASAPTHNYELNISDVPTGEWSCKDCG